MIRHTPFHGTSRLGRKVRAARGEVVRIIGEVGGTNVHVFGAVVTGTDGPTSDIDLVFEAEAPLGPGVMDHLEARLSAAVGADVYLVQAETLRPEARDEVLRGALPL